MRVTSNENEPNKDGGREGVVCVGLCVHTSSSSLHIIQTISLIALNVRVVRDGKDGPVRSASE